MTKLYVFGGSDTVSDLYVPSPDSYWGLTMRDIGADQVVNFSCAGQCFDNLVHIILQEDLDPDAYYLIGIPPIVRYSYYVDDGLEYLATFLDKNFEKTLIKVHSMTGVRSSAFHERFTNEKNYIGNFSAEWNESLVLEKVFLLAQYLLQCKRKFTIFNLSARLCYQDLWPSGMNIMIKLKQLPEILVFDHSLTSINEQDKIFPIDFDKHGWLGHHDERGHLNFYQKVLKPKLIELDWIDNA